MIMMQSESKWIKNHHPSLIVQQHDPQVIMNETRLGTDLQK